MKADFLFVGLNLNTIVQEKMPETCTFHGWCLKTKEHLNFETRLFFSALLKFLATRLVANAGSYQQMLGFVSDLIYVIFWFSVAVLFIAESTKFE